MNTTENVAILIRTVRASGATAARKPNYRANIKKLTSIFEFHLSLILTNFNIRPSMVPW